MKHYVGILSPTAIHRTRPSAGFCISGVTRMRRPSLTAAVVAVGLCLMVLGVAIAQVESTRVSQFDWRCESATGATISDHQRFDTAFIACLNSPDGAYVQGGRYRITRPTAQPAGTATLFWTPPTQNTDGTSLTNLAGFRIAYGTTPDLAQSVQIANPGATGYTISNLAPGAWYFAVRAYTSSGTESVQSSVVSKVVM